jgi:hypothetical protein
MTRKNPGRGDECVRSARVQEGMTDTFKTIRTYLYLPGHGLQMDEEAWVQI